MGVVDGNKPATDNDWEAIKKKRDAAIKKWIDDQLSRKLMVIVLIGSKTAGREWIKYEIKKAWEVGKGLLGIYVHNLKDKDGNQSTKGNNPFSAYKVVDKNMADIVKAYDPSYTISKNVYDHIKKNLVDWIEKVIEIRGKYA